MRIALFLMPILPCTFLLAPLAQSQASPATKPRGLEAHIDVTIRDNSEELLAVPANVKLFLNGVPCDQGSTSTGRISFSIPDLGKFTVVVEAPGYKTGQNEVSVGEPVRVDIEVNLQRNPSANAASAGSENPILAPKAKEALDKGMQALRDDKLVEAGDALAQASKLAPNNPQVLYAEGLLGLKKHDWAKAQTALETATQLQPNHPRALAALGMALCNQKKYAEAIPPLEKSLELDPTGGWETHWSLAESYYHSQRFDDALKVSQQAREESGGQIPQVDLLVARALTAVGRYDDSAIVLRELLKTHGEGPEAETARRFLERLTTDGKIARP